MVASWEIKAQRKVLVYTLHTELVPIAWAAGFRNLVIPGSYTFVTGMPFDHARNHAVQQFLASPFEWLLSLDSDVVAPPDTILRLLAHNQPIISGMYCRRSPPHSVPVAIKNGQWLNGFQPGTVQEVDLVGAGCLLVHRSVFEKVPPTRPDGSKRWYDWRVDCKGLNLFPEESCLSEDFTWCVHVRKFGYKVLMDTSIACKHVGLFETGLGTARPLDHNPAA